MNNLFPGEEINTPYQTLFYKDIEIENVEDQQTAVTDDYLTVAHEERLRAAKGIIYALIFCIPFWLFFIKFVIWLFQK